MNLIKIFSIFFILAFTGLVAQINIVANTSVAGQKFKIEIIENAEKYCITLKILKGFQLNKEYREEMEIYIEEFLALKDKSSRSDSLNLIVNKMNIITEKNSSYSTFITEIVKTEYQEFDELINLFYTQDAEFFQRLKNKKEIILDGTTVEIKVGSSENYKTIWAHSPREKSHPEIKNLLTSTLDIFRNKNLISREKKFTAAY